ncbi:trp operon leader peptide [Streptomyces sp. B3I7]|uniref:trp operon leader peptide n=1 Tax=Streptomyces sp. B3I7 TaxID=3042269 RepID=UPI00358EA75C
MVRTRTDLSGEPVCSASFHQRPCRETVVRPRVGRPGPPSAVSGERGCRDGPVSGRVHAMFAPVHRMWWWTAHPAAR